MALGSLKQPEVTAKGKRGGKERYPQVLVCPSAHTKAPQAPRGGKGRELYTVFMGSAFMSDFQLGTYFPMLYSSQYQLLLEAQYFIGNFT